MKRMLYLAALCGLHGALSAAEATTTATGRLVPQDAGGVVWESAAGRAVRIQAPQLTLEDASDHARLPFKVELKGRTVEQGQAALEFNRGGADGILRNFYRTIPEIRPGAAWLQGIHLVYYDYFQHYAYDHKTGKLLKEWTAFPGTCKLPMSLTEMHRRLKFAKDLGFRVLLYFCDGTNSDEGARDFNKDYVLKDKTGKTFPGWKGPDSLGQPWMMDPSIQGLRDWYSGYMNALLEEYARDVDGLVWDETFYIPVDFISHGPAGPTYADRAMMSLVAEMTRMVQSYQDRNPDLVSLASDNGTTSCALVAHGTYQDSGAQEKYWGPSMFANYRNSFWSCNWCPVTGAANNQIAAEKYGLPQGVSNGWGDNCGPSQMPPELLDAVLQRFTKNVESKRQHLRYLAP